ncbi:MAG: hypothetical protein FWG98_02120 [Candidatus Cloacimonetes bacterium]|nr:hypothetical protein [Candidatus Cloacimonadota bacterium]
MKYLNINEETLKNMVAQDFFEKFDCTEIIKNIDFSVKEKSDSLLVQKYFLWAEAKASITDLLSMLTQLILTIGKSKITDQRIPPPFLGCFDPNKIAFVEFSEIMDIFTLNDFNWNVTPSNTGTDEFKHIYEKLEKLINNNLYIFDFEKESIELKIFINNNFVTDKTGANKIQITKNNFTWVYAKWNKEVKPTIGVTDWDLAKQNGIFDLDFYLADLLSQDNLSLKEKLNIVLKHTQYEVKPEKARIGLFKSYIIDFNDGQKAHRQFWTKYERPPLEVYWDYIIDRRDLLVPQDIRERKGSFFTPQIWVELSQKYIADVFGEDWQENYYVWDCAAGTGNLLVGLTNKYRIYASTIDQADVNVMHERIKDGANLLEDHVFQFDFLNDSFDDLPKSLRDVIKNEPEKLIIYINPPYAEATSGVRRSHKTGVSVGNKIHDRYFSKMGKARNELFAQFLTRIYFELKGCKIGEFSKQKALVGPNFKDFRKFFFAEFKKGFVVPANSFDNVKGKFPIGFKIWDTKDGKHFENAVFDIYSADGSFQGQKEYTDGPECLYINDWIKIFRDKSNISIGNLCYVGNDFQHATKIQICSTEKKIIAHDVVLNINQNNLISAAVYFTVRKAIPATWLNDRDQFLFPNDGLKEDIEFQTDCLTFTLFHNSNNISSRHGTNHWIPFTAEEVNARTSFESSFMTDFINGKIIATKYTPLLFDDNKSSVSFPADEHSRTGQFELHFTDRAKEVFKVGKALWKYYHCQPGCNVNASFYDIREYFQSRDEKGKMKPTSDDAKYNKLLSDLKLEMKYLTAQIEKKIYEYEFLKK